MDCIGLVIKVIDKDDLKISSYWQIETTLDVDGVIFYEILPLFVRKSNRYSKIVDDAYINDVEVLYSLDESIVLSKESFISVYRICVDDIGFLWGFLLLSTIVTNCTFGLNRMGVLSNSYMKLFVYTGVGVLLLALIIVIIKNSIKRKSIIKNRC